MTRARYKATSPVASQCPHGDGRPCVASVAAGRPQPAGGGRPPRSSTGPRQHRHVPAGPPVTAPAQETQEESLGRPAVPAAQREEAAQGQRCWLRCRCRCWRWWWWWQWCCLPHGRGVPALGPPGRGWEQRWAQHRFTPRCRSQDPRRPQEEEEGPVSLATAGPGGHPWVCGGLTLAGRQAPTKAVLSLPLLSWTGERKYSKELVGRDKDRRDHSPIIVMGRTDLAWGKLTPFITNQPE